MSKTPVKAAHRPAAKKAAAKAPAQKTARQAAKPAAKKAAPKAGAKAAGKPIAKKATAKPSARPSTKAAPSKKPTVKTTANRPTAKAAPSKAAAPTKAPAKTPAKVPAKLPAGKPAPTKPLTAKPAAPAPAAPTPKTSAAASVPAKTVTATTPPQQPAPAKKSRGRSLPMPAADNHPPTVPLPPPGRPAASNVIDLPRPVRKIDPKLVNVWKTKAGRDLSDDELLSMPDSEYMNDKQLEFFKTRLMQQRNDLLENAGETTEHLREDTSIVPDPADRATIEEEHALELRTRDRERKLLKKISQSIARIEAGDYGYCDETGEPIGLGRLLARPTATLSLEAQQRRELKQKMFGD